MRSYEELLPIVQKRLGFKNDGHRFRHTLGVVDTAEALAKAYGADVDKARIAALLHDVTKHDDPWDQEKRISDYFGEQIIQTWPRQLYHGFSAYVFAKKELMIEDEEILNAILNHSVGRPDMTLLEKIVFAADYLEPNRGLDNDEIRAIAFHNLNKAVAKIILSSLEHVNKMGYAIVPLSLETKRFYEHYLEDNE
jgi:predicted HD superfamily hydrolase involved in NAD metabolism